MRPLASVIIACAIAVSLGSCSDEKPPPVPPTTATTPANPDATPPPMPQVAEEFSAKGAATFTAHFVQVFDYAYNTGDVAPLEAVSDPACSGCQKYIELIDEIYESGGSTSGRTWEQSGSEIEFWPDPDRESYVTTTLTLSRGEVQMSSSEDPRSYPASSDLITFGMKFDEGWLMSQFGRAAAK